MSYLSRERFEKIKAEADLFAYTGWTISPSDLRDLINEVERLRTFAPPEEPADFGVKGVRDPDNRCDMFTPGTPTGACWGDGHYLCNECERFCQPTETESD